MFKDDEPTLWLDGHQAEDLSAKMARKSKPIPPPLNLSAMGESDASNSPLKDFAMLATSPRSPLVQKNLPFRKRAHSYSSTQTSSECDSPDSPRVPISPIAAAPSPAPFTKSPLASPNLLGRRFLQEPIKSLLPSPNTSASFFNNECDPMKSPCPALFRPMPDLMPLAMMDKNSLKSPLQTPTRSVFLQREMDSTLFFMDIDKLPLNTPTIPRGSSQAVNDGVFVMPEPISVKSEPVDPEPEPEKENVQVLGYDVKQEVTHNGLLDLEPPLDLAPMPDVEVKREINSPDLARSQEHNNALNYYLDTYNSKINKNYVFNQNLGLYCSEMNQVQHPPYPELPRGKPANYQKPQTYRKNATPKRPIEKQDEDAPKKTKKELDDERPRRPMNAFMLFAQHQRPLLIQQHPGKDNRAISVVLGNAWKELDPAERADYVSRAAAMAMEHKKRHPDCWKRRRVRINQAQAQVRPPTTDIVTSS